MFIEKNLKSGVIAAIVVRSTTKNRLDTKCFRGTSEVLAGNFCLWNSAEELFSDREVMGHFLAELDEMWLAQNFGTHSVGVVYPTHVGWESTSPLKNYDEKDLEQFDLNRQSWGLRVKPASIDLLAPQTNELTIVYEFKSEDDRPVAVVHSIYPGKDIGELYGDVTDREQRVFFDWFHPGQV